MQLDKQVVDRIMGEVSYSGDTYQNALAVAYALANRARATGESLESVTAPISQVNARRKAPGSEKHRATVERAIRDAVNENVPDPTNGATFYATPKAFPGLQKGTPNSVLQKTATVGGHVFAVDPNNEPILTANGYKRPVNPVNSAPLADYDPNAANTMRRPAPVPVNDPRGSMADVPGALLQDNIQVPGRTRNQMVNPSLTEDLRQAVGNIYGNDASVTMFSGAQDPFGTSYNRVGSIRHDRKPGKNYGDAVDVHINDPGGERVYGSALAPLARHWSYNNLGSMGFPSTRPTAGVHADYIGGKGRPRQGGEAEFWFYPARQPNADIASAWQEGVSLRKQFGGHPLPSAKPTIQPAQFLAQGPTSRPNNRPSPFTIPQSIQQASQRTRDALGDNRPTITPQRASIASAGNSGGSGVSRGSGLNSVASASRSSISRPPASQVQAYQQYGQSRSAAPQYITKQVTRQVPLPSKPQAIPYDSPEGQKLTQAYSQYGMSRNGVSAPIPTAKPAAPEFKTVTETIQVPNPAYKPMPQVPMAPVIPQAKPAAPQGFLGALGGMFSPAGMAGGLAGNMVAGPLGGLVGNLAGRGIANVVQNNPTIGNRGTTNSYSTASNSGGPYAGQTWRNNGADGGTRVFNPSTRQYENIGGNSAGQRSSNQSTGSGGGLGGFFSSIFG